MRPMRPAPDAVSGQVMPADHRRFAALLRRDRAPRPRGKGVPIMITHLKGHPWYSLIGVALVLIVLLKVVG